MMTIFSFGSLGGIEPNTSENKKKLPGFKCLAGELG
jgi:hypothetical protein